MDSLTMACCLCCALLVAVRSEDVQPPGFRSTAGGGAPRVLGAGFVHDGPGHLGHMHQNCVVDSIVRDQFVAESRWWFDRAEEEEELQNYLADHILDMLVRETVGVLNAVQEKHARRAAEAGKTGTSRQCPEEQAAAQPKPKPKQKPGPRHIGVLRHAERADALDPAVAASLVGEEFAWPDQDVRPYDTPISDFDHPRRAAEQLKAYGFTRIISSPFRRCLQTAAAVAAELGVEVVDVHKGVGEAMAQVKRNGWPDDNHELTYLTEEEMSTTLAVAARAGTSSGRAGEAASYSCPRLGEIMGEKPCFGQDDVKRMR